MISLVFSLSTLNNTEYTKYQQKTFLVINTWNKENFQNHAIHYSRVSRNIGNILMYLFYI